MKLLIVQTGAAVAEVRERYGDFPEWFRRGMRLTPERVVTVRVDNGGILPPVQSVAAAVITGSGAMVTEHLDWSERTAAWLRMAAREGLPMLGVCYGHQLLAHALGGRVDYNPRGREIGTVDIQRLASAADDPLFAPLRSGFRAHATHLQSVLQPPADAVVLATSTLDGCQAVRYAPKVWGVQFHPEFGAREMRAYLRAREEAVDAEGLDAQELLRSTHACPQANSVLRRFVRIAGQN